MNFNEIEETVIQAKCGNFSLNAPIDSETAISEFMDMVESHFNLEDNFLRNKKIKEVKKLLNDSLKTATRRSTICDDYKK